MDTTGARSASMEEECDAPWAFALEGVLHEITACSPRQLLRQSAREATYCYSLAFALVDAHIIGCAADGHRQSSLGKYKSEMQHDSVEEVGSERATVPDPAQPWPETLAGYRWGRCPRSKDGTRPLALVRLVARAG